MKILRVKLTNLNSLRGKHELNFQSGPLAGVALFAITGPTGAGKSTLLDAITLALYGKAARYGAMPSPEDMMSRHCGECAAEVEFQVPSGIYRAEWQLRRSRGLPTGNVQAAKRYVYDVAGQPLTQNVRDTEALIEKLIGLDYARFLRSAMLAQGDFAQFLKAKPDERASLLESLTGTSIYSELGTLAHTETVRRENELKLKEASIQGILLLDEAQRLKLAVDIPAAESVFSQVKNDLQSASDLLNKASNLTTALSQEQAALNKHQALLAEYQAAEQILRRLSSHRLSVPFHGELAKVDAAQQAVVIAQGLLKHAQGEHSLATRKAMVCLQAFHQMIDEQAKATQKEIEGCSLRIAEALKRKSNAETWLAQNKVDKALPERLADLISDLAGLKSMRRDVVREWDRLSKLAAKLDPKVAGQLPPSADDLTAATGKAHLASLVVATEKNLVVTTAAKKKAEAELKLREDHLNKAKLISSFEEHRGSLKKGEPCPLCGAEEHPFAEGAEPSFPFKDLEGRVTEAKVTCRKAEKTHDDLEQLRDDLTAAGESLLLAVAERSEILDLVSQKLRAFILPVPAVGTEDETKTLLQQRANAYTRQTTDAEKAEREHANAGGELKRLNVALKTLDEKSLSLAKETITEPTERGDAEQEKDEELSRWTSVLEADTDWSEAKGKLASARAVQGNRQQDTERLVTAFSKLTAQLTENLMGSAFKSIDDLKAAHLNQADATKFEVLENDLNSRNQKVAADLRAAREAIKKCRDEGTPEGEAVPELKNRQSSLQTQHNQLIQDLTTWKNQLTQDDSNRRIVADKQKELEADRRRLVIWQRLRGLIGSHDGRTFRRYAQSVSLDVLVHFANRQLLRLSDRYRLRRREGDALDLEIEDEYQAGAVRPMASLSGGESFLASLALALGLSDVAGRNVQIESLFIDEGFGSLDSDTLDVAISALETLRQDYKTVGIISHVDLLKERIATQIIVEKQSAGTSCLRVVS